MPVIMGGYGMTHFVTSGALQAEDSKHVAKILGQIRFKLRKLVEYKFILTESLIIYGESLNFATELLYVLFGKNQNT